MKIPQFVSSFVIRFPRRIAVIAAAPAIPVGSYILPFWHDCEIILAVLYLFTVIVIVDVKVEGSHLAEEL
jgi:hypothetical protein